MSLSPLHQPGTYYVHMFHYDVHMFDNAYYVHIFDIAYITFKLAYAIGRVSAA